MPTPKKGRRLGGSPAHQRLMLANLATNLFEYGAITTTEAKARQLRPFAERLITKAKRGDLHNRRQVLSVIRDKSIVHVLFTEIGPKFADRPGGYTRITKIGPRKGDNAPMAVIELVEEEYTPKSRSTKPATRTAAAAQDPAEDTAVATGVEDAEGEAVQVEAQDAVAEQAPEGETVETPEDEAAPAEEVEELPVEEPTGDDAVDQAAEEVAEEAAQEAADEQVAAEEVEELPVEEPTGDDAVDQAAEEVAEEAAQEAADEQVAAEDDESK